MFKEKFIAPNTFITKNKRKTNISVRTLHKGEIRKPEKEKIDQKTESNKRVMKVVDGIGKQNSKREAIWRWVGW